MCLDIDPDSVIHKHLNKKISNTIESGYEYFGSGEFDSYHYSPIIGESYGNKANIGLIQDHNLTMLPSFHISLGAPLEYNKSNPNPIHLNTLDTASLVGLIALAPINISKKDDKKSAWIPLYPTMFRLMQQNNVLPKYINLEPFHSMSKELHISLANLTGNPHDSIARPEDCIIDTITA